jgi:hypothetical protein
LIFIVLASAYILKFLIFNIYVVAGSYQIYDIIPGYHSKEAKTIKNQGG